MTRPVEQSTATRLEAGDQIRVVATVAVVVQHVAQDAARHPDRVTDGEWAIATAAVGLTKWAVPVFVMLSGALLLAPRPNQSVGDFYKRRLSRVGVPLLFWSGFYMAARAIPFDAESLQEASILLLRGRPFYHMFFLFVIAGLYAFTPMLRTWCSHAKPSELEVATGLALAVAAAAALLGGGPDLAFTLFVPYLGYFLAGRWIRQNLQRISKSSWPATAYAFATASLIGGCLATGPPSEPVARYLLHYQSVPIIVLSVASFAWLLTPGRLGPPEGVSFRVSARLSGLTLGIYLIHPAILKALALLGVDGTTVRVELALPAVSAFAFLASAAATAVIRKLRLGVLVGQ